MHNNVEKTVVMVVNCSLVLWLFSHLEGVSICCLDNKGKQVDNLT